MIFYISKCLLLSTLIRYNIYNDRLLKVLMKNIYKCGVIPVKMVQWGLPYMKLININKDIIDILENTYDRCPIHNIDYTRQIYKEDYYNDIDDDYDIIDIVGSGSIAQVYKIKDRRTGQLLAMKVKHPTAINDFNNVKFYLKIIFTILPFNKFIPISLYDFLSQFEEQLNFINESNNLIKFYELYENNSLYKIPKLYKFSKNIIIMEHVAGKSLDTFKDNNIQHYKYHIYIYIFTNNNLFINDFNHGDLHNYNWKITEDNKVVIYDFGLCWKLNDKTIIGTLDILNEGFHTCNNDLIYDAFYNYVRYSSDIDEKYVKEYFNNTPIDMDNFSVFCRYYIYFCIKYSINININILYNIISYQHIVLTFQNHFVNDDKHDHNGIFKEEYNICDYFNILPEYKKYLKIQTIKYEKKDNIDYSKLYKFIT